MSTNPVASWTFVCDGLNTHQSESLVRFVAEACWFGILNRKLLKRKSYLSVEQLTASIRRFIEHYINCGKIGWKAFYMISQVSDGAWMTIYLRNIIQYHGYRRIRNEQEST